MRRLLRPIVISLVSLGLALGASVGLAAPALAETDTTFTAAFSDGTLPILDNYTGHLTFGGFKSRDSIITGADVSVDGETTCSGPSGIQTWSCDFALPDDSEYPDGQQAIHIHQINSDGTRVDNVMAFGVYNVDDEAAPYSTTPVVSYSFFPGGVQLTTTEAGSNDDTAGTQIWYYDGESTVTDDGCPASADDDFPVGTSGEWAAQHTCTRSYDDNTYVFTESTQANTESGESDESDENNGVFLVPNNSLALTSTVKNTSTRTVTITGTGNYNLGLNSTVEILNEAGAPICQVLGDGFTADPSDPYVVKDWSCTTSALSYGTHNLNAVVQDTQLGSEAQDFFDSSTYITGALSSATPIPAVTFTAPTTPGGTSGDTTPNWSFTIGGDLTDLHPGDTITITGSGLPSGTTLDTVLHSTPTDLGTVVAAADGTFTQTVTIPADVELGDHSIQVTASGPGITTTTKQQAITVTAPAAKPGDGTGSVKKTPTAAHTPGKGGDSHGTALAPNILTKALTPFADIAVHPNKIVSAFEIGLVLLLLAVLPAHLLNATIAEQSDRFERRFGKLRAPNWLFRLGVWFRSAPVVGGIIVTLTTAILFGFADPKFGFTLASLRLILACGIALFLVGYVANALTGLIARVQWNIVAAVSTRPYGLILTVVGVIVSRALHFSPGFLIGLILGLTIQGKSASGFAWRTVVLRSSIVLTMAIAAWIGYSTLTLGGNEGGTFGSALLVETLVAITTEGVVALLVELLPLRFLEGERVYAHSRVLWGIFYFLTLVVFVLAVVPWEGNWDALHGSLWIWIVVLAAFAALCIGIYIYFRRFAPPLEEEEGDERVALGETVAGDRS